MPTTNTRGHEHGEVGGREQADPDGGGAERPRDGRELAEPAERGADDDAADDRADPLRGRQHAEERGRPVQTLVDQREDHDLHDARRQRDEERRDGQPADVGVCTMWRRPARNSAQKSFSSFAVDRRRGDAQQQDRRHDEGDGVDDGDGLPADDRVQARPPTSGASSRIAWLVDCSRPFASPRSSLGIMLTSSPARAAS